MVPEVTDPIFDDIPALADSSVHFGEGCGEDQSGDPGHMGDFGIGNGRVFALAGYACPLNTLHTMAGPDYQQEASFYPDTWFELERDGRPVEVTGAFALRPRRSGGLRRVTITSGGPIQVRLAIPLDTAEVNSVEMAGRSLGESDYELRRLARHGARRPPDRRGCARRASGGGGRPPSLNRRP